jgi:hypothetical protein
MFFHKWLNTSDAHHEKDLLKGITGDHIAMGQ